jgi:hypothetical protein
VHFDAIVFCYLFQGHFREQSANIVRLLEVSKIAKLETMCGFSISLSLSLFQSVHVFHIKGLYALQIGK